MIICKRKIRSIFICQAKTYLDIYNDYIFKCIRYTYFGERFNKAKRIICKLVWLLRNEQNKFSKSEFLLVFKKKFIYN